MDLLVDEAIHLLPISKTKTLGYWQTQQFAIKLAGHTTTSIED